MLHYEFAAVYAALLPPSDARVRQVLRTFKRYASRRVKSVFDPCCGPASWLLPLAQRGLVVAGNDLEPAMVVQARRLLHGFEAELTEGDMCELNFAEGPFDAALNLEFSVGHLADRASVPRHLDSVHRHLKPGGIFLLQVVLIDADTQDRTTIELDRSPFVDVPGEGAWSMTYRSLRRDGPARIEEIEVELARRDGSRIVRIAVERYDLLAFTRADIATLIADSRFELAAAQSDGHEVQLEEAENDVVLVLRALAN